MDGIQKCSSRFATLCQSKATKVVFAATITTLILAAISLLAISLHQGSTSGFTNASTATAITAGVGLLVLASTASFIIYRLAQKQKQEIEKSKNYIKEHLAKSNKLFKEPLNDDSSIDSEDSIPTTGTVISSKETLQSENKTTKDKSDAEATSNPPSTSSAIPSSTTHKPDTKTTKDKSDTEATSNPPSTNSAIPSSTTNKPDKKTTKDKSDTEATSNPPSTSSAIPSSTTHKPENQTKSETNKTSVVDLKTAERLQYRKNLKHLFKQALKDSKSIIPTTLKTDPNSIKQYRETLQSKTSLTEPITDKQVLELVSLISVLPALLEKNPTGHLHFYTSTVNGEPATGLTIVNKKTETTIGKFAHCDENLILTAIKSLKNQQNEKQVKVHVVDDCFTTVLRGSLEPGSSSLAPLILKVTSLVIKAKLTITQIKGLDEKQINKFKLKNFPTFQSCVSNLLLFSSTLAKKGIKNTTPIIQSLTSNLTSDNIEAFTSELTNYIKAYPQEASELIDLILCKLIQHGSNNAMAVSELVQLLQGDNINQLTSTLEQDLLSISNENLTITNSTTPGKKVVDFSKWWENVSNHRLNPENQISVEDKAVTRLYNGYINSILQALNYKIEIDGSVNTDVKVIQKAAINFTEEFTLTMKRSLGLDLFKTAAEVNGSIFLLLAKADKRNTNIFQDFLSKPSPVLGRQVIIEYKKL